MICWAWTRGFEKVEERTEGSKWKFMFYRLLLIDVSRIVKSLCTNFSPTATTNGGVKSHRKEVWGTRTRNCKSAFGLSFFLGFFYACKTFFSYLGASNIIAMHTNTIKLFCVQVSASFPYHSCPYLKNK